MSLSIHEVSIKLGVSISTVREWERRGKIVSIRTPGGHRRYKVEDIRDLMKKGTFELKSIVKLIQTPTWRIKGGYKEILHLSVGDIGEIVSILGPQYDFQKDQTASHFLYGVNWLDCKDPMNKGKESSVEPEDIILVR